MSSQAAPPAGALLAGLEAVLFDLGGTCLELDHPRIERILREHAGVEPGDGWIARAERAGRREMEAGLAAGATPAAQWRAFFDGMAGAAGAPHSTRDAVFAALVDYHRRHHLWGRIMPGMPQAVRRLAARGYRVAAVSNSDGRAEWLLARLGLLAEFEFVVDSQVVGVEKPEPRIFHLACERLGLPPRSCAYVGDVLGIDVVGAQRAGLVPVLFDAYGCYPGVDVPRAVDAATLESLVPARPRAGGAPA